MQKHSFKIVLADNAILTFESKQTIDDVYIKKIGDISMLCFYDSDLMINKDRIKEIYIDEIEIRLVGIYKVAPNTDLTVLGAVWSVNLPFVWQRFLSLSCMLYLLQLQ